MSLAREWGEKSKEKNISDIKLNNQMVKVQNELSVEESFGRVRWHIIFKLMVGTMESKRKGRRKKRNRKV